jgi:hypothetical protein
MPGHGTFKLDRTEYRHWDQIKIRYSRPTVAPEGQQYWIAMTPANAPDSEPGAWHYVKQGATTDLFEVFKSDVEDWEIRFHDVYPQHPHRVLQREKFRVPKDPPKKSGK